MTAKRQADIPVVDEDEAPLPEEAAEMAMPVETARSRITDVNAPITVTFAQLARAVHETFYRAIPAWDQDGVARVGRATARLLEAIRD